MRWIRKTNFFFQTTIMLYSNKAIKEEVDLSNNEKYDMQKLL
jgi:hypothetical protein